MWYNGKTGNIDRPCPVYDEPSVYTKIDKSLFTETEMVTCRQWVISGIRIEVLNDTGFSNIVK